MIFASIQALKLFHHGDPVQANPAIDMPVILSYISQHLLALGMHLTLARAFGIKVNSRLEWYHSRIDRLCVMASVLIPLWPEVDFLRPHFHCSRENEGKSGYGLTRPNRYLKDEGGRNSHIAEYILKGREAAKYLEALDKVMTEYFKDKLIPSKGDAVATWLAEAANRFLSRSGPSTDPENEPAVFAMATRGYREILLGKFLPTQGLKSLGTRTVLMMRALQINHRQLPSEKIARAMYGVIGQFYRESNAIFCESQQSKMRLSVMTTYFALIMESQLSLPQSQHRESQESPFADLVKLARSKLPYAKPGQIFQLAEEMYASEESISVWEMQLELLEGEVLLSPKLTPSGAKRNPSLVHKMQGKGPGRDILRRVRKDKMRKR